MADLSWTKRYYTNGGAINGIELGLTAKRPTRLWRIIHWLSRRRDRTFDSPIAIDINNGWDRPVGVYVCDGKMLFQPLYDEDETSKIWFVEGDIGG